MKALIDTNIILDILLKRQPYYEKAAVIFGLAKRSFFNAFVSASAITDIFYISKKDLGKNNANKALKNILQVFHPADVTGENIFQALEIEWDDFEDSVQYIVGESLSVDFIITRNTQDFASGSISAVTPEQFIQTVTDTE